MRVNSFYRPYVLAMLLGIEAVFAGTSLRAAQPAPLPSAAVVARLIAAMPEFDRNDSDSTKTAFINDTLAVDCATRESDPLGATLWRHGYIAFAPAASTNGPACRARLTKRGIEYGTTQKWMSDSTSGDSPVSIGTNSPVALARNAPVQTYEISLARQKIVAIGRAVPKPTGASVRVRYEFERTSIGKELQTACQAQKSAAERCSELPDTHEQPMTVFLDRRDGAWHVSGMIAQ